MSELKIFTQEGDNKSHRPEIILSPNGLLSFKGAYYPNNAAKDFEPLFKWIEEYIKNPARKTKVDIEMDFNEISVTRGLGTILKTLKPLNPEVNWYLDEDDEDMMQRINEVHVITGTMKINVIEVPVEKVITETCQPINIEGGTNDPTIVVKYAKEKNMALCTIRGNLMNGYFTGFKSWLEKYRENPKGRTIVVIRIEASTVDGRTRFWDTLNIINNIPNTETIWIVDADDKDMCRIIEEFNNSKRMKIIKKTLTVTRTVEPLTDEKIQQFIAEL